MKVHLIDYTGFGHLNPMFAAALLAYTKNTRLEQGEEGFARFLAMSPEQLEPDLKYIAGTLRSSWEFVSFVFQINDVTRAFTHQFVRTRTASYAQQAMRVIDARDHDTLMPDVIANGTSIQKYYWNHAIESIRESYSTLLDEGIAAQDARGLLPTNILTNICAKMNLRTLADLVGKRQNLRAQGEYADVVREMAKCVLEVMPWAQPFLYPERTQTPALDKMLKEALGARSPIDAPEVNAALKELDTLKATWG